MFKATVCILVLLLIQQITAGHFTLYQDAGKRGQSRQMQCFDYNCHDIGAGFNDEASSINTHGGCVALFEHGNCQGRRVIFKPGCELGECCKHGNFKSCGFNDEASSYACC
uniref:Uncharacterized protein n=1 Tax=Panagrolaimus sp. JU765 TaxID=591449 RepID=A0AC34QT94_9BILA